MNINWFKNPDNIVYADIYQFMEVYDKDMNIWNFRNQIEAFRENPVPEGKVIRGRNQTSIRILIPKLLFPERFEKDENVWIFMGRSHPCYCLDKTEPWRGKEYFFFSHKDCEYFPCHETENPDLFNCLFCFCPLYCLGDRCGGSFQYFGDIKDCSGCKIPHSPDSYGYIMRRFPDIIKKAGPRP